MNLVANLDLRSCMIDDEALEGGVGREGGGATERSGEGLEKKSTNFRELDVYAGGGGKEGGDGGGKEREGGGDGGENGSARSEDELS